MTINQVILVREIWLSNIDQNCKTTLKQIIEENFGPVENIEFFVRGKESFAFIKFSMVKTAYHAFTYKERLAELL